jgi:glycosyltransferase involved in cell wall biosynthesis
VSAFVLSGSRLSGTFRAGVERIAGGNVVVVLLPELRRLGPLQLLRRLRELEGICIVAVEDPAAEVSRAVLEGLAVLTRATRIEIVHPDLSRERASRVRGLAALGSLAGSAIEGRRALHLARRELAGLLAEPRARGRLEGDHVLYLNANLWFGLKAGGSVTHVAGVVNALVEFDRDVVLATAVDPVGVTPAAEIVRLEPPRRLTLPVESNYYRFGRNVPEQLRGLRRPSFVYQRHSIGSYAGAIVARREGIPLVLEYNGSEVWAARNWGRPLAYERLAIAAEDASLRHAHLVVTVSQVLADELVERGVEPGRVVWHPNGVDAERFDPARFSDAERRALRARYGIPDDALLTTFVGTFGQWHGVDVLAQAIRLLAQNHPDWIEGTQARFLLVGDGLMMPDVERELVGLGDLAVLTGLVPQDETPLYLAASDILVSPHVPNSDGTPFFGSPTKLFEYMAAGKPIVASDLDQIGDVLRDGLAVLVRPGDAHDLARGLRTIASDEEKRRELGTLARDRVLERYTWHHHVVAVLEGLRRVASVNLS